MNEWIYANLDRLENEMRLVRNKLKMLEIEYQKYVEYLEVCDKYNAEINDKE